MDFEVMVDSVVDDNGERFLVRAIPKTPAAEVALIAGMAVAIEANDGGWSEVARTVTTSPQPAIIVANSKTVHALDSVDSASLRRIFRGDETDTRVRLLRASDDTLLGLQREVNGRPFAG